MKRAPRLDASKVVALHELALVRAKLQLAGVMKPVGIDMVAVVVHLDSAEAAEMEFEGFNGMCAAFIDTAAALALIDEHVETCGRGNLQSLRAQVSYGSRNGAFVVDLLPGYERLHLLDHAMLDALSKVPRDLARDVIHLTRRCLLRSGALALIDQTCEENLSEHGVRSRCLKRVRPIVAERWSSPAALLTAIAKARATRAPHAAERMPLDLLTRAILERQLMERSGLPIEASDDDPISVH